MQGSLIKAKAVPDIVTRGEEDGAGQQVMFGMGRRAESQAIGPLRPKIRSLVEWVGQCSTLQTYLDTYLELLDSNGEK